MQESITIATDIFTLSLVPSQASQSSLPRKIVTHPRTCHPRSPRKVVDDAREAAQPPLLVR
jgi:hypothetical protein